MSLITFNKKNTSRVPRVPKIKVNRGIAVFPSKLEEEYGRKHMAKLSPDAKEKLFKVTRNKFGLDLHQFLNRNEMIKVSWGGVKVRTSPLLGFETVIPSSVVKKDFNGDLTSALAATRTFLRHNLKALKPPRVPSYVKKGALGNGLSLDVRNEIERLMHEVRNFAVCERMEQRTLFSLRKTRHGIILNRPLIKNGDFMVVSKKEIDRDFGGDMLKALLAVRYHMHKIYFQSYAKGVIPKDEYVPIKKVDEREQIAGGNLKLNYKR